MTTAKRLNWGCGEHTAPGWINSDANEEGGADLVCDIRQGLPLEESSIDYAVSVHALPELAYPEVVPALRELRRVLKPSGVLRLVLPDLDRAIRAYLSRDDGYFKVTPEEARSPGGRFIVHMLWHGHSRTPFHRRLRGGASPARRVHPCGSLRVRPYREQLSRDRRAG